MTSREGYAVMSVSFASKKLEIRAGDSASSPSSSRWFNMELHTPIEPLFVLKCSAVLTVFFSIPDWVAGDLPLLSIVCCFSCFALFIISEKVKIEVGSFKSSLLWQIWRFWALLFWFLKVTSWIKKRQRTTAIQKGKLKSAWWWKIFIGVVPVFEVLAVSPFLGNYSKINSNDINQGLCLGLFLFHAQRRLQIDLPNNGTSIFKVPCSLLVLILRLLSFFSG